MEIILENIDTCGEEKYTEATNTPKSADIRYTDTNNEDFIKIEKIKPVDNEKNEQIMKKDDGNSDYKNQPGIVEINDSVENGSDKKEFLEKENSDTSYFIRISLKIIFFHLVLIFYLYLL